MTCKDCLHNGLCKDMHKFGVVDLPYNDDGAACDHYKSSADVVEVVRCKDCKNYWYNEYYNLHLCGNCNASFYQGEYSIVMEPNDFCSYGERETE